MDTPTPTPIATSAPEPATFTDVVVPASDLLVEPEILVILLAGVVVGGFYRLVRAVKYFSR